MQQQIQQYEIELDKRKLSKLVLDAEEHSLQEDMAKAQEAIAYYQQQCCLDQKAFYEQHLQPKLKASDHAWVNILQLGLTTKALWDAPQRQQQMSVAFMQQESQKQVEVLQWGMRLEQIKEEKQKLWAIVQQLMREKERLERNLSSLLPPTEVKAIPAEAEIMAVKSAQTIGVGAADLLKSSFNTFTLPGELGRFFGNLERQKLAIGLVGDPGAGKSTFSFAIAQLFDQAGLSVIYFSLELGIGEVTRSMIARHPVSNRVRIVDVGTLEDVRQSTQQFDCIIIDSFGKLNCKVEELDRLRIDFPTTIFLFIFQKTTQGTSRGGSAVNYDSSMVIDVIKRDGQRIAMMEKSRYGTIGWEYDLDAEEIIKS